MALPAPGIADPGTALGDRAAPVSSALPSKASAPPMSAPSAPSARPGAVEQGAAASRPEPLLQTLQSLWHELPGLLNDRVELLTLELQRAGIALAQIVALVIAAAVLGVTVWLVLWGGIVAALVASGLALPWALGAALGVNLLAAWLAVARVRALLPQLRLPGTRRHLMLSPSAQPRSVPPDPRSLERHNFTPAGQPTAR